MGSLSNVVPVTERAVGMAAVLGLGVAVPANEVQQSSFPDYYFHNTNSDHMTELKHKFTRICEKSMIKKRYMCLTEEMLCANPSLSTYRAPSLDACQELMDVEVPRLAAEAALRAAADWGGPLSDVTHLIFCSSGGASMPGVDYKLIRLLSLPLSTKRFMLYQQGCFGGGTVLRLAKDLAEIARGARVLAVCSVVTSIGFCGPCETQVENVVGQACWIFNL